MISDWNFWIKPRNVSRSRRGMAPEERNVHRNKSLEVNKAPSGAQCAWANSFHIPLLTELVRIVKALGAINITLLTGLTLAKCTTINYLLTNSFLGVE